MLPPSSNFFLNPLTINREQVIHQICHAECFKDFPSERILKALDDQEIYKLCSQRINALCVSTEALIGSKISTYPYDISNKELKEHIKKKIAPNLCMIVKVRTVESHLFESGLKKAREIQLAKKEWGFLDDYKAWGTEKKRLKKFYLMHGILESPQFANDPSMKMKQEYANQLQAACLQGYKITFIVPYNFDEEGQIKVTNI